VDLPAVLARLVVVENVPHLAELAISVLADVLRNQDRLDAGFLELADTQLGTERVAAEAAH
jgi:hypothetical protein